MRWKGSYTVEAAFVIPIVLGVVFVLLYALFWVHDQCVLQANIQNGLIQYSDTERNCQLTRSGSALCSKISGWGM